MTYIVLVFTIFITYFCCVYGQSACSTPDGQNGTCIFLEECPPVVNMFTKPDKTQADIDFLRSSKCGNQGNMPKVCCPIISCQTPESKPGVCISIFSCPQLASFSGRPVLHKDVDYIKKSKYLVMLPHWMTIKPKDALEQKQYSVCCPQEESVVSPGNCAVSVFPAHPSTRCCGEDAIVARILGYGIPGGSTEIDAYPWLALIEYTQEDRVKLLCGGTLISGKYVLTAAHCVTGDILKKGHPKNVRLGEFDILRDGPDCEMVEAGGEDCTEGVTTIPIELTVPHPGFNMRDPLHDIALIRLKSFAPYTDFIRPICLPTTDVTGTEKPADQYLYVAGWKAGIKRQAIISVKTHTNLHYTDKEKCQSAYNSSGRSVQLSAGQICAGAIANRDPCKGDSGGPLMYLFGRSWEVIGVSSFGPTPCGISDVPMVYTKVYEYINWIRTVIVQ